jgi:ATP-dependent DNA ligase
LQLVLRARWRPRRWRGCKDHRRPGSATIETKTNPFKAGDPPRAQAEFQEWTASRKIRHASFRGLRGDKDHGEVRRETPTDVI